MGQDAIAAWVLLPFPITFMVFTVSAGLHCIRHPGFEPGEKLAQLVTIFLVPFFGAVFWFETARRRERAGVPLPPHLKLPSEVHDRAEKSV